MTGERLKDFAKSGILRKEGLKDKGLEASGCGCLSAGAAGTTTDVIRA